MSVQAAAYFRYIPAMRWTVTYFSLDSLYHIPQLQKITHFVTISLIFSHPALPLLKHPLYKPVSEKRMVRFPEAFLKRSCLLPTGSALTGLLF